MKKVFTIIALLFIVNIAAFEWDRNKVYRGKYDGVLSYSRGQYSAMYDSNTNEYRALKNISTEESPNSFEALSDAESIYLELEAAYKNQENE